MFVSYSCPRFDCTINVSILPTHGPSVVSSILLHYKVCLYEPVVSQCFHQCAILLKALGGGIRVLWAHI